MNVHGHQEAAIWHPRPPMGARIVRPDVDFRPRRACCSPCRRALGARRARLARLDVDLDLRERAEPPFGIPASAWAASIGRPGQVNGTNLAGRIAQGTGGSGSRYFVQVRKLQMGIGIHEDVCVDQVCYTSGPSDGVYRRDATMSRWALTDADGWSTLPDWSFDVDAFERDWLQSFMNDVVGDQIMSTNVFQSAWYFAGNVAKYVGNGFCITFSQKYFNDMASMVSRRRGGTA